MLDKMIKTVDEEPPEEGIVPIDVTVLPHIQHWNLLVIMLLDQSLTVVTVLPAVLGVSAVAILAVVALTPIYLSVRVWKCVSESFFGFVFVNMAILMKLSSRFFGRLLSIHQNTHTLDGLREGFEIDRVARDGGGAPGGRDGGPSGEQGGGSPLGVRIMHTQDTPRITNTTRQE